MLWLFLSLFSVLIIATSGTLGAYLGYQTAQKEHQGIQGTQAVITILEQYELGLRDLESGRYELARQRFEYVLENDPEYPDAADNLLLALQVLYATATPTPIPPTITPTPTPDLRPIEDLFTQAQSFFHREDWNGVINTLVNLRKVDSSYRVVEVDSLLYRALRMRGIDKIRNESNLEGGIYDLALAERFGPLDAEANKWRNLARIYMIGSSFWEVHPVQAVYYFGQLASAAPYLRDASGWTARERYRAALIQYGDMLAKNGEWCEAEDQYNLALEIYSDDRIAPTATYIALKCSPPTSIPTDTPTITLTTTVTFTLVPGLTPTVSPVPTETATAPTINPTATETQIVVLTETPPIKETPTPTPTISPTSEPPPTATDTQPPPTPTPTPSPGFTPTPE